MTTLELKMPIFLSPETVDSFCQNIYLTIQMIVKGDFKILHIANKREIRQRLIVRTKQALHILYSVHSVIALNETQQPMFNPLFCVTKKTFAINKWNDF